MPVYKDPNVPEDASDLDYFRWVRLNADLQGGGITCIYNGYSRRLAAKGISEFKALPSRSIKKMTGKGDLTEVYIECCLGQDMGTYVLDSSVGEIIEALEREGLPIPQTTISWNENPSLVAR
ncbi:MAG: hypothetical protein DI586_01465 [Micavibrio aeruginosavorus]|uniref:Uncharacterized protein n=1 Tax=Micavibrio aeruginosavorus TaxID=349221 RepID=A0A2W5FME5_9BACT|nr:MAG: hypothetical protein DI586_01465 [Micavibrio aeruginosavorus]